MGNFSEKIAAILAEIAQFLGLKPSESRRIELMEQKLAGEMAGNVDRLEALKEKIKLLENQALFKKKEHNNTKGQSRRILGGEIGRIFRDLDRLNGQENVIAGSIERISNAQAKLGEYKAAQSRGLSEDELDDIAVGLQEVIDELKGIDRASKDLKDINYNGPEVSPVNVDERFEELGGEKETDSGLSVEVEKRLKELETEKE